MTDQQQPGRPAGGPIRFEAAVTRTTRTPYLVVALVGLFVAAALLKPWELRIGSGREAPADGAARAQAGAATPRARSTQPPASAVAVQAMCLNAFSWRTATIEQWDDDQTVRVWRSLDPHAASGPRDPDIDVVPAVGETVPAIGYCAPAFGPESPLGPARVVAWRVDADTVTPIALRQVAPVGVVSEFGALFGPPDEGASWPDGTYVFRYSEVDVDDNERWFAVEVRTQGGVRAPPGRVKPPASAVMQPGGGRGAFFLP
jgi:hypothetical protein